MAGTIAVFGGSSGGEVTVASVLAGGITFNTAGYSLQPLSGEESTITTNASSFVVDATAAAAIAVTSIVGASGTTFVKQGEAKLTLSSALVNMAGVRVDAGELAIVGTSWNDADRIYTLASSGSATLSFNLETSLATVGGLSGGGVVRSDSGLLTLALAGSVDSTFSGALQDFSSSSLILTKTGTATQTLTGTNTHSGATSVSGGTLRLADGGSLLNSAVSVSSGGALVLDNTGTASSDRLGNDKVVSLGGGTLQLLGSATGDIHESAGTLVLSEGASSVTATKVSSSLAQLLFAGLNRVAGAVLEIGGDGAVLFSGVTNTNGILGGYAFVGDHWAALNGSGEVVAYSGYAGSLTSGASTDNVRLTAAANLTATTTTRNSLALDTSAGDFTVSFSTAATDLRLTSGGLLATGSGTSSLSGGRITSASASRDLVAMVRGSLSVSSAIVDNTFKTGPLTTTVAVGLTKAGEGTLSLTGANTYSGDTRVLAGTLTLSGGSAVADSSAVTVYSGATLRLGGSTETIGGLAGGGTVALENGHLTVGGSGLSGELTINLGSGRLTSAASLSSQFSGSLSGTGGLHQTGNGTLTLAGANTFTGALRITAGSVLMLDEGLDVMADTTAIELAGGTFGFSPAILGLGAETMGTLMVESSSTLQFHASTTLPTTLSFADSSSLTWNGPLIVTNYTSSRDVLRFGLSESGLTPAQLALIQFDLDGVLVGARIGAEGFVEPVAVPEPATWAALLGAGALIGGLAHRRRRG